MKQFSKTYNSILAILFVLLSLNACKKTDSPSTVLTPGDYIYQRTGDYSGIRLFTHDGEIHDQKLIGYYNNKYAQYIYPIVDTAQKQDTFHILSTSQAKYYYLFSSYFYTSVPIQYNNFNITKIDNYYKFSGVDTLNYVIGNVDSFGVGIKKYKEAYYNVTGFILYYQSAAYHVKTFRYYYASCSNNSLIFPELNYIRVTSTYNDYPYNLIPFTNWRQSSLNNVFDNGVLTQLHNKDTIYHYAYFDPKLVWGTEFIGDTLIVQTFNRYYSK